MARAHKQRILIAVIALCLAAIVIYAIFSGSNQFSLTVGGRKIFTTIFSAIKKLRFWLPCEQMERLRKTKSLCITQK